MDCLIAGTPLIPFEIPRWRNILFMKNYVIQSTTASKTCASFHSSHPLHEKWKNKWDSYRRREEQPSKNYVRYATRQKRADTKKALNNLLYHSGCPKESFQDNRKTWKVNGTEKWFSDADDYSEDGYSEKSRPKSSQRHRKSHKKNKRKIRRESFYEELDDYPETIFGAKFGSRWCTWSFDHRHGPSINSHFSFEWRDGSSWSKSRSRKWEAESDIESDDETCSVGSTSDRNILGLPATGPLNIEDVKDAFRKSALKWHPDKHQGPTQEMAGEKFKLCLNAYKSLCSALSPA